MATVPIQVVISVGWFSVYRGMYGVVWIGKTFGIQEWDTTIIAKGFHCEFDVVSTEFKWLKSVYLFLFNYAYDVIYISFPPRGRYG